MSAIENVGRRKTRCPHCDVPLSPLKTAGALLAGCPKCRGVWLDRKAFANLCPPPSQAKNPSALRHARLHGSTAPQTLRCPVCCYSMDAKNLENSPGHTIDVCRRHGAWLDANELQAILTSIKDRRRATNGAAISTPVIAAAVATTAPMMTDPTARNDRSVFERTGEIMSDALEMVDFIDLGDIGDLLSSIAEIGVGLFDGL